MNETIERLRKQNQLKAELAEQSKQAQAQLKALQVLDQRMIEIAQSLVKYWDGKQTKTETTAQLKTIGTPDALKVMKAVNDMHSTLKKHKNTDLSEVTRVMKGILKHVAQLPKETPTFESKDSVSITNLPDFDKYFTDLQRAVTSLVTNPKVNVEAPDLSKLEKKQQGVIDALGKGIEVTHTNVLIHEKFDEWRLVEDDYDEDEPVATGVRYYLKGKKVAELKYTLNGSRIIGVKKV